MKKLSDRWCIMVLLFLFFGCKEEDAGTGGRSTEDIFIDYQVWGEEGKDLVTVLLRFYEDGETGETIRINEPGSVALDGEILQPDSAKMTGYFYEQQKNVSEFAGKHTITLTDENKQVYEQTFDYTPFELETDVEEKIYKEDLTLTFNGLKEQDVLRIIMIDTVFNTDDINEMETVTNGKLTIQKEQFNNIHPGPITLLILKEEERTITDPAIKGGKLLVTYGLKREFELVE